jgi:hypothetical protein
MRAFLVPLLLLAACSQPAPVGNRASDIDTAAGLAQNDVDTNVAIAAAPIKAPSRAPLEPAEPGQPGGLPDDKTPVAEAPSAPNSPPGAATVVETYYALIEDGKYRRAWSLWGEKGAASGMSAHAFATSFAKYSEYHASVGAPGREDAGAGQRYVTVPVQVYARLKTGAPVYWRGQAVLHRTADIDGASAEDKKWRIRSIDLKRAPPAKAR